MAAGARDPYQDDSTYGIFEVRLSDRIDPSDLGRVFAKTPASRSASSHLQEDRKACRADGMTSAGRLIGYRRVSSADQNADRQLEDPHLLGCD